MTAKFLTPTNRQYIQGLETDKTAAEVENVDLGTEFFAEDTGRTYRRVAAANGGTGGRWRIYRDAPTDPNYKADPTQSLMASGDIFRTAAFTFPDLVAGAAYADLDAIGIKNQPVIIPVKGVIQSAVYRDLSAQGLQVDLWLFDAPVANQSDNGTFSVADADMLHVLDVIQFIGFRNGSAGQVSTQNNLGIAYNLTGLAPTVIAEASIDGDVRFGRVFAQLQARGALTVTALQFPWFSLGILT